MNTHKATGILAASVALALPVDFAHAQGNSPFAALEAQIAALQASLGTLQASLGTLQSSLTSLHTKVDALAAVPAPAPAMVPFAVQTGGGLCDSGLPGTSNPQILVEGTGTGKFVVTSVLIKTAPQGAGEEGYTFFTANSVAINGTSFDTRTGNLAATVSGFGVQESADLMGMPVRLSNPHDLNVLPREASPSGGNFPHQIVADSAGSNDVRIQLFCRSDVHDLSVETVRVSGWRAPGDTISATYVPGN